MKVIKIGTTYQAYNDELEVFVTNFRLKHIQYRFQKALDSFLINIRILL